MSDTDRWQEQVAELNPLVSLALSRGDTVVLTPREDGRVTALNLGQSGGLDETLREAERERGIER